jgi:hypothetical protein
VATATEAVSKAVELAEVVAMVAAARAGVQALVVVLAQAVVVVAEHLCFLLQAAAFQGNQW